MVIIYDFNTIYITENKVKYKKGHKFFCKSILPVFMNENVPIFWRNVGYGRWLIRKRRPFRGKSTKSSI